MASAGCQRPVTPDASAAARVPRENSAAADSQTPPETDAPEPDPVDEDAERVLAAMPVKWQEMLARAEEFDRRERVGWCVTCHVNTRDELRGGAHDENDISCTDCHGPSERHARNENNEVKPDQVFARRDVDRACAECHDCSRATSSASPPDPLPVCTDCHPAHRFPLAAAPLPKRKAK